MAGENRTSQEDRKQQYHRYYHIAGITIRMEADLPITDRTFAPKFREFEVDRLGTDLITIRHHFRLPELKAQDLGKEFLRRPPWVIYRQGGTWIYWPLAPDPADPNSYAFAIFNQDHTWGRIFNNGEDSFLQGGLNSLVTFATDQVLLARVLADRQGCFFHSSAAVLNHRGLLFVGHSEAGKSTIVKMLNGKAQILCDDRNIVRRWPEGFRVHGTWNHGEVPLVSSASAPLGAIFFLKKSSKNCLLPLENVKEIVGKLIACLIKPDLPPWIIPELKLELGQSQPRGPGGA